MKEKLHPEEVRSGGDGGRASSFFSTAVPEQSEGAAGDLHQLEVEVARQRQLLSEAAGYLSEAAYLARYHQPALERHIRAFLDELPE